jgi:hypothetical protein
MLKKLTSWVVLPLLSLAGLVALIAGGLWWVDSQAKTTPEYTLVHIAEALHHCNAEQLEANVQLPRLIQSVVAVHPDAQIMLNKLPSFSRPLAIVLESKIMSNQWKEQLNQCNLMGQDTRLVNPWLVRGFVLVKNLAGFVVLTPNEVVENKATLVVDFNLPGQAASSLKLLLERKGPQSPWQLVQALPDKTLTDQLFQTNTQ